MSDMTIRSTLQSAATSVRVLTVFLRADDWPLRTVHWRMRARTDTRTIRPSPTWRTALRNRVRG